VVLGWVLGCVESLCCGVVAGCGSWGVRPGDVGMRMGMGMGGGGGGRGIWGVLS
jgi:hypothetical protein